MKAEAIEGLYDQLETVEGQQRSIGMQCSCKGPIGQGHICQIRNVKNATGEIVMKDDERKERWGQYFNMLMNKENQRVEIEEREPNHASNDTEHQ